MGMRGLEAENSICKGVAGERAQGEGLAGAHDLWVLLP